MTNKEYEERISRNLGIISIEDQKMMSKIKVVVAGCGADGGDAAISLARMGVRRFSLADPDIFEISNINRQEGAFLSNIGKKKVTVIADLMHDLDPQIEVSVFDDGVNELNINSFISDADIVLEEIDYKSLDVANMLYSLSRDKNIPVVTGLSVGWNAYAFYFSPNSMTFEEYIKLTEIKDFNNIKKAPFVPSVPSYIKNNLVRDVFTKDIPIPVVVPAVKLSSALVSFMVYALISGKKDIKPVPHYYSAGDLFDKEGAIMD